MKTLPWRLGLLLLLTFWLSLSCGSSGIDWLIGLHPSPLLWSLRLPRVLLGALAGAALAVSGAVLQTVLHNPLAEPYIMGISGGAALGGVLALCAGCNSVVGVPLSAFGGALSSLLLLLGLAQWRRCYEPFTLLLAGIMFNAMGGALVTLIQLLVHTAQAQEILFWLMGSVGVESWPTLAALSLYELLGYSLLRRACGVLNMLALGDVAAAAGGVALSTARLGLLSCVALLVGATVALVGMLGFVGLLVPHVMRRWVGVQHQRLLPACAVGGACTLMLCDALARLTFYYVGSEIPAGAITAGCGGPLFVMLLFRQAGRSHALGALRGQPGIVKKVYAKT